MLRNHVLYYGIDQGNKPFFLCRTNKETQWRLYYKEQGCIYGCSIERFPEVDEEKLREVFEFRDYRKVNPHVRCVLGRLDEVLDLDEDP